MLKFNYSSRLSRLILALGLIPVSLSVTAGSISTSFFDGMVYGQFLNPDSGYHDYVSVENNDLGHGASVFEWGCTSYQCQAGSQHSGFSFDGVGSDPGEAGFEANLGEVFSLGAFSYSNMPTYHSESVYGVDFNLGMNIHGVDYSYLYMFDILNTPNSSNPADDYIALLSLSATDSFNPYKLKFNGDKYELELLGFSSDGGSSFSNAIWLEERSVFSSELYARINPINPSPVPLPAAAWLFMTGLVSLIGLARKKRQ